MIKIRDASLNDVEKLQRLNDEVFLDNYKYDNDLDTDWAKSEKGKDYFMSLLNNPESVCLIAEDEGSEVGYIAAKKNDFGYRKSKYLEIENMGVIPDYRSKGIGSRLIAECIKQAKEKGFDRVYVNSYFKNAGAINFYKENGFSEIDISLERVL